MNRVKPFSFEEKTDFIKRYTKAKGRVGKKFQLAVQAENVWSNYRLESIVSIKTCNAEYYIFKD